MKNEARRRENDNKGPSEIPIERIDAAVEVASACNSAIKGKQIKRAIAEEAARKGGRKMRITVESGDGCSANQLLLDSGW